MKIPIVDKDDNVIEYRERNAVDANSIYRVSALWVTDSDGNILLARRALNKSHNPGKWGPAVAGTVEADETYESNIIKEATEEIGLEKIRPIIGNKKLKKGEWTYFAQEFILTLPSGFADFKIDQNEVAEVRWFSPEQLKIELRQNPDSFLRGIHERMSDC